MLSGGMEKHGFVTICNQKKPPIHSLWRSNRRVTKILRINAIREKTEKYEAKRGELRPKIYRTKRKSKRSEILL